MWFWFTVIVNSAQVSVASTPPGMATQIPFKQPWSAQQEMPFYTSNAGSSFDMLDLREIDTRHLRDWVFPRQASPR